MCTNVDRANTFLATMKFFTKATGASFVSDKFIINSESGNLHFSQTFDIFGFMRKKKRPYTLDVSCCEGVLTTKAEGIITIIPFPEKECFLAFCSKTRISNAKTEVIKTLANVYFEDKGDILMPVSREALTEMLVTCKTLAKSIHTSHDEVYTLSSYIYNLHTIASFLSNEAERKWDVVDVKHLWHLVQSTFKSDTLSEVQDSTKIACDKLKVHSMMINVIDICGSDTEYNISLTVDDTRSMARAPVLNSMHFTVDSGNPAMLTLDIVTNKKIAKLTPLQSLQIRCIRSTVGFLEGVASISTKHRFEASISLPVWYVVNAKTRNKKPTVIAIIDSNDDRVAHTKKVCESLGLKCTRVSSEKAKHFFNKKQSKCLGAVIVKIKHHSQVEKFHNYAPSVPFIVISDASVPRNCMRVSEKDYSASIKKKLSELVKPNDTFIGDPKYVSFFADKHNKFVDARVLNFETARDLCAYVLHTKTEYIIITDDVKRFTDVGFFAKLHTKDKPFVL